MCVDDKKRLHLQNCPFVVCLHLPICRRFMWLNKQNRLSLQLCRFCFPFQHHSTFAFFMNIFWSDFHCEFHCRNIWSTRRQSSLLPLHNFSVTSEDFVRPCLQFSNRIEIKEMRKTHVSRSIEVFCLMLTKPIVFCHWTAKPTVSVFVFANR